MFIKKGISFSPEQVDMKIFAIGTEQMCLDCGKALDPSNSQNGIIKCTCGYNNPTNPNMGSEHSNGK
jgi:hypothetical protein